jgi:hypothetical protein
MSREPRLPFENTYWVIPSRLLAGPLPAQGSAEEIEGRLSALLDAGVDHIINLMEDREGAQAPGVFPQYQAELARSVAASAIEVTVARFPIPDMGLPEPEQMRAILQDLGRALAAGRVVYVHCWGGKGRTGTVIGCYLTGDGDTGDAALQRLSALRLSAGLYSASPETEAQREFVRGWPILK